MKLNFLQLTRILVDDIVKNEPPEAANELLIKINSILDDYIKHTKEYIAVQRVNLEFLNKADKIGGIWDW